MINEFNKIQREIGQAKNVLLVGHPGPDGDCLGAMTAMADYVLVQKKEAIILVEEEVGEDFDFLPHSNKIIVGKENIRTENYDLILALDASSLARAGLQEILSHEERPVVINIDHHITNSGGGDINLVRNVSSTCEIVYDFFEHVGFGFGKEVATAILLGIMTDTGNFSFANTSERAVLTAAKILGRGADLGLINKRMYLSKKMPELKSLGRVLERLEFNERLNILAVVLTKEDLAEEGVDFRRLSNFLQQVDCAEITMVLKEQEPNEIRVSMRSKNVDVSALAKKFGGGGHKKAAGFSFNGRLVKSEKGGFRIE